MTPHDLAPLLRTLPTLNLTAETTAEEAMAAHRMLGSFNQWEIGLVRFAGQPPWERHPDDELLHVLDGEVELTLLTDPGPARVTLRASSLLVVPRGVWHRSFARTQVALIFVTPSQGNEHSFAEDPRSEPRM